MRSAPEGDENLSTGAAPSAALAAAFDAGGEMGGRIRGLDWSGTPLGAPHTWPASLSHAVSMMLASQSQIVMFWGDEHVAFYNDAYLPTIGRKHPGALGRPAREHWGELWPVLAPLFVGVARSGQAYQSRDHPFLLERYGYLEETYFDISYDPLRVEDGTIGGIFCIVSETTGRVLGERRLRALAELGSRLSDMKTASQLGEETARVLGGHPADVPFSLLYLGDPGAEELTGWSGVGDESIVVRRADGDVALPPALAQVLGGGPATLADATDFVAVAPETAAARVLVLPITAANESAGALVVGISRHLALVGEYRNFFDLLAAQVSSAVTNQRAYEQARSRAAQLAALDRAKTTFFANVSHEFRTPLTLILGPIEDVLSEADLPARYQEPLDVVQRNALRLLKLVNTVLDFSRLEAGRHSAVYQPTDLADYTARLTSTFRSAAERVGLRLVVDCPPLRAPVLVDREMWEKIVFNLLSNALKFTFDGSVTVRLRATERDARLEVIDTGVGIPADEVPQLFERFHRVVGTPSRVTEGTGIGLALVRQLAELHGGSVAVESRLDQGSTFTVTVPFGDAHLPAERVRATGLPLTDSGAAELYLEDTAWWDRERDAPAVDGGRPGARRPGRILVADDNADLRDHVVRLLSPYWQVVAVPDGAAALEAAVTTPFDLVLSDVMMPGLDGFGLVAGLRGDPRTRHLPIVLLSARAGEQAAVEGLAAGADDYLVKPFSGQELVARVRASLELGQLRGRTIRQLRALADAAVAVNTARSTADVIRVAAEHAEQMVAAARVVASVPGARYEADGGGDSGTEPSAVVPLVGTTGEQLGELRVWSGDEVGADTEDVVLAQLARLVGVRLENAQLYEAEQRIATTLQHSLLPQSLPKVAGVILASRYLPGNSEAEVGGDWYDVIPADGGELVLVIGDVVGKGVQAAATMGQLRNALRAYVLEGFDPGPALTRLNRLVRAMDGRSLATVFCLRFDPRTGQLRYASAGHPSPLIITPGDSSPGSSCGFVHERALGPPVGAIPGTTYVTMETELEPGSRILLYTDGLIEDRAEGIDEGLARLCDDAVSACDHVEDLVDRMVARVRRQRRRDDVAVLALEAAHLDRFALRLPADPTKLTVLRRRLEDFLVAHNVTESALFDLTVAISEAAANAIEHPMTPIEPVVFVEVAIEDRTVVARVRDTGQWRAATEGGFRGRGLALIGALAELTVSRTADGTEVTLRRPLDS
ncbi:SpoIIE family protein phosphatase [Micromonospora sp. NPDC049679]|uniref:SpoIIE family protein phosphatase n=1 Tax=Micromonospora sp. NPDC049679 TaxID=3155920 RepID=UPI0033F9CDD6